MLRIYICICLHMYTYNLDAGVQIIEGADPTLASNVLREQVHENKWYYAHIHMYMYTYVYI